MLKELHHYVMPKNAEMHHFMCLISHEPEGTHYCTCSIYHMPEEIHHRICPILTYARRTALLHALDILCARRNASLHVLDISCARGNTSSHMPNIDLCSKNCTCTITYARYCMCPILQCARGSASSHCARYCMCPKKCIIACARYCMCPKKCIITLCPRLHCARSLHKLKIASCSKFTCARIKSSHKYQQMSKTDTLSLLITDIPRASSSKGIIFHSLRTSCHGLRTYFMHIMFLRRHSLKASSSWPADIISWPKGLISSYHNPKVS